MINNDDELDARQCIRLAHALLLCACLDAYGGDGEALAWIAGEESARWADLVDLVDWPPKREQLASERELRRRARDLDPCAWPPSRGGPDRRRRPQTLSMEMPTAAILAPTTETLFVHQDYLKPP